MSERFLAVVAHCRGQMWKIMAQSFEPGPLNSVSVSFSVSLSLTLYLLSYGIRSDSPPAPYFCILQANNAKQNNVNREA